MDERLREVTILIADSQTLFREGLRVLLEEQPDFRVVGEASTANDAVRLAKTLQPAVLLLDLALQGTEVLEKLVAADSETRTVLLTADIGHSLIRDLFSRGARGVILKESPTAILLRCIRSVAAGQYWVVETPVPDVGNLGKDNPDALEVRTPSRRYGLTDRELEVLVSVIAGRTNRQIAEQFSISEQTVKHHLTHIFDKVGVYNRLELALFAIHHGLVRRFDQ